jgi:hypothetical protein
MLIVERNHTSNCDLSTVGGNLSLFFNSSREYVLEYCLRASEAVSAVPEV